MLTYVSSLSNIRSIGQWHGVDDLHKENRMAILRRTFVMFLSSTDAKRGFYNFGNKIK